MATHRAFNIMVRLKVVLSALLCLQMSTLLLSWADDALKPVEDLVRCSDLVVLVSVRETLHDGVVAGPGAMVHTRHVLRVERYFVGSGPDELMVLTPGGYYRNPDGRETVTSIMGGTGPGVLPHETFLAFLQVFAPAYRFVPRGGSKAPVMTDESTGERTVKLHFGQSDLLGEAARERYEKLKLELPTVAAAEREASFKRLEYALTEDVPVAQLSARIGRALRDVGGPKSPNTTCY